MSKRNRQKQGQNSNRNGQRREFKIELLNSAQKLAWAAFQKHDVLFLIGPAGTGKTFLATAFAIKELLAKEKEKIVLGAACENYDGKNYREIIIDYAEAERRIDSLNHASVIKTFAIYYK